MTRNIHNTKHYEALCRISSFWKYDFIKQKIPFILSFSNMTFIYMKIVFLNENLFRPTNNLEYCCISNSFRALDLCQS